MLLFILYLFYLRLIVNYQRALGYFRIICQTSILNFVNFQIIIGQKYRF